ncbi:hydantoinase B/oxoprolinase family protein [Actinomadura sp. NAK00032]|uniref:hydantoinase B/oxoprolinase family protein n=1 Tax=Actinomadura sp. NAK00032 TaxID=2742128 RepID=UPI001591D6C3|nr:hydantoinase B/oxoprolinase family protein [Actinomadura sp. NAK00032]QKW33265.1 hydantoinase B/oxoprolinase family protein [Actinomadura sp. NAK00032]
MTDIDPITAEIIRAGFVAITEEMKTNLMRTAYNLIIYEAQDFTVGLFDADGETISVGLGLPMFVGGLSDAVKAKLEFYGRDGISPGDILLTNDAYIMGSHLNHMIFTLPIFHDGELIAFAASMAHWIDVGGVLGGTTTDIYSEGLQVPVVKIFKEGVQDDELTRLIAMNVRFEDLAMGDFRAQVAAVRTGETRMRAMLERYGAGAVRAGIADVFRRGEELSRQAVRRIPDGEYRAEAYMDDDAVKVGERIPVRVRVVVEDDVLTVDLSEMSPQVAGYFNSGATAGRSAAQVAFKCLTSPDEYPINHGSLRPLRVVLPPGTVVSAVKPAAMRLWMTYPMTVVDCVFRAMADVVPGTSIAGHHADLGMSHTYGVDEATGRFFQFYGGPQGGGWGATSLADGQSATMCVNDGDTHNAPVEVVEAKYPMVTVEEYALVQDSGGAGAHRGGLGTRLRIRVHTAAKLDTWIERTSCAPWGLDGGHAAARNHVHVERAGGEVVAFPNGKVGALDLAAGDAHVIELGGGGGHGDPRQRPVEKVLADVRAGYVSAARAQTDYGVAVTGTGDDVTLDAAATARLRNGHE